MINLEGVTAVRRRIAEIEQTFGNPQNMLQGADFASNLRNEIEKMKNSAKVDRTTATNAVDAAAKGVGTSLPVEPNLPQVKAPTAQIETAGVNMNRTDVGADGDNIVAPEFAQPDGEEYTAPSAYDEAVKTAAGSDDVTRFLTEAAARYGLDSRLVSAIAQVESSGNQLAISPAGAIGVMQLMPDTAAALGVDPYDLESNIDGGAKYIKSLLNDFGGDVRKAVAAYNAGPNAVRNYGGVPPYAETQNYVSKVLDLYQ